MDAWGVKLLAALKKTADLLALGLQLPKDTFSTLMQDGPHLLGPTGQQFKSTGLMVLMQIRTLPTHFGHQSHSDQSKLNHFTVAD